MKNHIFLFSNHLSFLLISFQWENIAYSYTIHQIFSSSIFSVEMNGDQIHWSQNEEEETREKKTIQQNCL